MSKLTKLIKTPNLFFRDYFAKRSGTFYKVEKKPKKPPSLITSNLDENYLPVLALHSGEGLNAGIMHLEAWISLFIKSKVHFIILVRNEALYTWIKKKYPGLPLAYARGGNHIEDFLKQYPSVKTIFYPSSTGNNIHLVRFNYLKHIFIGHGDSDKASSANKALRLYDEIWVAGEAHIDRFRNQGINTSGISFKKIGRPNSFDVFIKTKSNWYDRELQQILYLPTWEGGVEEANYSSSELSYDLVKAVKDKFDMSIACKYHPLTANRKSSINLVKNKLEKESYIESNKIKIIPKEVEITTCIDKYTLFICDLSAVVTDCLAADAPIFLYEPLNKVTHKASSNMSYSDFCYIFSSIEELLEKISLVLAGDDYLKPARKRAQQYFIGYEETMSQAFLKQMEILN